MNQQFHIWKLESSQIYWMFDENILKELSAHPKKVHWPDMFNITFCKILLSTEFIAKYFHHHHKLLLKIEWMEMNFQWGCARSRLKDLQRGWTKISTVNRLLNLSHHLPLVTEITLSFSNIRCYIQESAWIERSNYKSFSPPVTSSTTSTGPVQIDCQYISIKPQNKYKLYS